MASVKKIAFIFFISVFSPIVLFAQRDSTAVDSVLMKQLEQQMQPAAPPPAAPAVGRKCADNKSRHERDR